MKVLKFAWLSVLLLMVLCLSCKPVETGQVEFEKMLEHPEEHWYDLKRMGMKYGHIRIYLEKVQYKGKEMIRSRMDIVMRTNDFGKETKIETKRIQYLDSNFALRYFVFTSNASGAMQVEGTIRDSVAYITTTLNGETTESEVAVPDDTLSDIVVVNYLLSNGKMNIGKKLKYHKFDLDLLQPIKTELLVVEEASLTYQSEKKQVYILEEKMDILGGINSRLWVASNGIMYKAETDMSGVSIVITKTDRETALGAVELVNMSLGNRIIPTGKKPKQGASRFVANLQLSKGSLKNTIMTNSRQKLELNSERSGTLSIEIPKVMEEDCVNLPIENPEFQTFLSATVFIEAAHPDIRAKAVEILDGEVNSWRASKKLCKWVYKSIDRKVVNSGWSSALKTLESLTGDNIGNTVLLIAMARSVGIPARICSGLIFLDGIFYYHIWPEVYVGTWIQMDPAVGQIIADPLHIQLHGSILESGTMNEFTEGSLRTLNQLEIEIVE